MAQRIQTLFIDDIDGGEAEGTVRFALDGSEYEIDLNAKHAEELRSALAKYVTCARKVGAPARRGSARGSRKPATLDTVAVRTWAREHGIGIKERGRVPAEVLAQYQAAVGSLQPLIQSARNQSERISGSIRIGQAIKRSGRQRRWLPSAPKRAVMPGRRHRGHRSGNSRAVYLEEAPAASQEPFVEVCLSLLSWPPAGARSGTLSA